MTSKASSTIHSVRLFSCCEKFFILSRPASILVFSSTLPKSTPYCSFLLEYLSWPRAPEFHSDAYFTSTYIIILSIMGSSAIRLSTPNRRRKLSRNNFSFHTREVEAAQSSHRLTLLRVPKVRREQSRPDENLSPGSRPMIAQAYAYLQVFGSLLQTSK